MIQEHQSFIVAYRRWLSYGLTLFAVMTSKSSFLGILNASRDTLQAYRPYKFLGGLQRTTLRMNKGVTRHVVLASTYTLPQ